MFSRRFSRWYRAALLAWIARRYGCEAAGTCPTETGAQSVTGTILVLAPDQYNSDTVTGGLDGYGIAHKSVIVPQFNATLPSLNDTATEGNYGGIVVVGEVGFQYENGWYSALSDEQWQVVYSYQETFGVRMARLNSFPLPEYGVTYQDVGQMQEMKYVDDSYFPTANLKTDVTVPINGLWNFPASITNASIATEVARFLPTESYAEETVAAVINDYGKRQQLVYFVSWAIQWSPASNYFQHGYIHFITRGLFAGNRKTYLSAQIDDVFLGSPLYLPEGDSFRSRPEDMDGHVAWQINLNQRLPAGSNFFLEMAHNGNGAIIESTLPDPAASEPFCDPNEAVYYPYPPPTDLEYAKPLGTGSNIWEPQWVEYAWSDECMLRDPLAQWFKIPENRDAFAHLSHTFSHMGFNNATYEDAEREIQFNQAWMTRMGIDQAAKFSAKGLVPPAITGLHNGDVLRAWMDNGLRYVVGDNTRPPLRSTISPYWPIYTTAEGDGHAGVLIIPRFATRIYYNCDKPECNAQEWIDTSPRTSGDFSDLLDEGRLANSRYLLNLHHDPYMFHQANLRQADMPEYTIGDQTGKMSLVQMWTEVMVQEMMKLTNWPIVSLKHDDIAQVFIDRMALDQCEPVICYKYSADGSKIVGVKLSTKDNTCAAPVPVTLPGDATSSASVVDDKVGNEPMIKWVTMAGSPVELTLSAPIAV